MNSINNEKEHVYTINNMIDLDNSKDINFIPIFKDFSFKYLFNKFPDLLKEFALLQLKPVLNLDYDNTDMIIKNNELLKNNSKEYNKYIDNYLIFNNNIHLDIELNNSYFSKVKLRNNLYKNKIYSKILESGDKVNKLKDIYVFQLNINVLDKYVKYGEDFVVLFALNSSKIYTENECIIIKYIEYYRNLFYNKDMKLQKDKMWLVVLASRNYQELYKSLSYVVKPKVRDKVISEVIKMGNDDTFILHEWEREKFDRFEREMDIEEGIEIGIMNTIQTMLKEKCSFNFISKITGKSIEEIKKIKDTLE